jgi:hypothetical protein
VYTIVFGSYVLLHAAPLDPFCPPLGPIRAAVTGASRLVISHRSSVARVTPIMAGLEFKYNRRRAPSCREHALSSINVVIPLRSDRRSSRCNDTEILRNRSRPERPSASTRVDADSAL